MAGQADGRILVDSEIDPQGFETGSKRLQSAAKSLSTKVESLGTTFQKALGGNPKALETFQAKAAELQQTVERLGVDMARLGAKKAPTDVYKDLGVETEKAGRELEKLLNRQDKLDNRGTSKTSQTYKNLQADIAAASARYDELAAKKAQLENSGAAWTSGTETAEYQAMASAIDAVNARLSAMRERIEEASSSSHGLSSVLQHLPSPLSVAKSVFGGILNVVKSIGTAIGKVVKGVLNLAKAAAKKLLSAFKAVLATVKKLFTGNRSLSGSVGGLTSALKKLVPAMLAARGVMGILRKGVNAFLEENEQVSNQLQACWGGLGEILGPIITRIVNLVSTAISYVTAFLRLLGFGVSGGGASTISAMGKAVTGVGNATKAATVAYGAAGNAAKVAAIKTDEFGNKSAVALNAVGGAATIAADEINTVGDAAESAQKKIQNLSGLDQLNTWKSEQDAGGGGAGGGGGVGDLGVTLPEVELPDWAKLLAEQLRSGKWEAAAKTLSDKLNEMVDSVDWPSLGDRMGEKLAGVLKFLATFIREFDFTELFTGLFTTLERAINKLDAEDLGALLAAKFVLIFSALQGAVESGVIPTAIEKLGGAIEGFFKTIREKFNDESDPAHGGWYVVGQNFGNVIGQIINAIASLLSGTNWNQIVGDIGEFWSGLWNALRSGSNAPDWGRLFDAIFDAIQTACKRLLVRMLQWLPQSSESKKTWQDLKSRLEKGGDSVSWGDIFRALWHTLGDLVRLLIDNIPSVGELKKYWNSLKDELAQALGYANWKSLSADFKNKIVEVLTSAFNMAGDALYNALKESHPKWAAALFPEQARIEEAAEQFRKDYDKNLSTALGNLNLTIQDMILSGGNADVLKEQALQIIGDVTGVYLNSYDDIYAAMASGVLQPTADAMYDGTELAFQAGDAVGEAASNGVDAGAREGAAASGATWLAENFSDAVANCKAAMAQGGSEAGAQFINALVDEGSLNIGEAAQLAQEVANQLKNERSQFATAAQSLADEYNGKLLENVPGARAAGTALGDASAGAASGVAEASVDMSTAAETAAQTVAPAIEAEQGSARTAGEAVGAAATEGAGEGIEGFEDTVSGAIEGSAGRASAGARVLRNRVHNEIRPMRPEVAAEFEGMGSDMSNSFSSSSSSVGSTAQSMASAVKRVLSTMQRDLTAAMTTIKTTITTNLTAIRTSSDTNWAGIKTSVLETDAAVRDSVTATWKACLAAITEHMNAAASVAKTQWAYIQRTTEEANAGISASVSSSWSSISSTAASQARSVSSTVTSVFNSLKSSAYSWGADLGTLFASGMRSKVSSIASAASAAASAARAYLHFSVPDKGPLADADEYGGDFIKLLADRMTKNKNLAARAASRVATAISAGIQDGEYTMPEIQVSQVDAAMDTFGDRIAAGFASTVDRLQAIADSITFRIPSVATAGAIPYSVTGGAPGRASQDAELLTAVNKLLAKVDATNSRGTQYTFIGELDGKVLFRKVIDEAKAQRGRSGMNPFMLEG